MIFLFIRSSFFLQVVEVAPAPHLPEEIRQSLFKDAITICKKIGYSNAGTVEFLVDQQMRTAFIEVNPRVQVEHTITGSCCFLSFHIFQAI